VLRILDVAPAVQRGCGGASSRPGTRTFYRGWFPLQADTV
jgi:hypothetical protein